VFVRDAKAEIVGGLLGGTYWGWLYVDILWVKDSLRGQGYGRALLAEAEQEAVRRGCRHAHLDTMSFQALEFYQQQGYTVFGELHDLPTGHSRHFMKKRLQPESLG
jgi:GNAT superfamily N-acetyltransferase